MALVAAISTVSCGGEATAALSLDVPKGLEGLALVVPADNALTAAKALLGSRLFFDQRLSRDGSMACQSCHQHAYGWTDGQRFSTKVNGQQNTRNSPSLYNVGYQPHYYWDGRAATLEANVAAAWKGHMGGDPDAVAQKLQSVTGYVSEFAAVFGEPGVSGDKIVAALSSFVRSLRSGNSAYDRGELSAAAQRGQTLFNQRCQMCHLPPLFTDHMFHNVGVGEQPDPGRGKIDPELAGAFKTPSLRSAAKTGPYFHDGSAATLREAVAVMARGGIENEGLAPVLLSVRSLPAVSEADIDDLVAFVESLTSVEAFPTPAVPD